MKEMKIYTIEKELYYQGQIVIRYKIEYPEVKDDSDESIEFNRENRKEALYLKEYAEGELYEEAKRMYEFRKKSGKDVIIYELIKECKK